MTEDAFRGLVEEGIIAIPEHFRRKLDNVAFLVAPCPTRAQRKDAELLPRETLLGLYEGIPLTERGDTYGVGMTMPDRITIFQDAILEEAGEDQEAVRTLVRDTVWHEVAHYFGYDDDAILVREEAGTNHPPLVDEEEKMA